MRFRAIVERGGKTATGIEVPTEVVEQLRAGKRPPVLVTVGDHRYRTTVASRGGRFLVPLSAENRAAAGVEAGDTVDVQIDADTASRDVTVPADLADALGQDRQAGEFFAGLAYTHRQEWARWIEQAKQPGTRSRRLAVTLDALRAGRRTR